MTSELPNVPSAEHEEQNKPGFVSIIREFCLNTSAHGLPSIARSQSKHNRIFWSISFVGFLGATIYFIVKSIQAYFDYETNIDISYEKEWPQYFPAVSLCSLSPFRFDQFMESFVNYTNARNLTDTNDTSTMSLDQAAFIQSFMIDTINRNQSLKPYSFSLESILQSCSFNGVPCSAANFTSFFTAYYGHCFTFNGKLKNISDGGVRFGNIYGGIGVLSLGLYVHTQQYVPYISYGAGVLLLVHDNEQTPLIEASGLELSTGQRHKLSYTKKRTDFVSSPVKECTDTSSTIVQAAIETYEDADYAYSEIVCYQTCEQTFSYQVCGCVNPTFWNVRTILSPKTNQIITASICNITDPCPNTARDTLYGSVSLLGQFCSTCKPACSLTDFMIRKSSSRAPLDWDIENVQTFAVNSGVPLPADWSNESLRHIENNYLSIVVLRETDRVEIYTQKFALSPVDVLSNVGGQTGLWIGISFFSIMELVEMIYRLARHQFYLLRSAI